jgi:uncharacterized protein involved in response to NO
MNHFFFSIAFRPLFLLAGLYAPLIILLWLLHMYWQPFLHLAEQNAVMWHSHEMLYGFVAAAVGGFLFTAVANWTGRAPVHGTPLIALCVLWILGRYVMLFGGDLPAIVTITGDLSYLVLVVALLWRELYLAGNRRNYIVLGCIGLLLLFNLLYHLEVRNMIPLEQWSIRGAIGTVVLLITIIGGRIVPAFTRNWLMLAKPGSATPTEMNRYDTSVVFMTLLVIPIWVVLPNSQIAGTIILLCGVMQGVRLSRWKGFSTLGEPLLFILHLAYSWIPVGFILLGAGLLFGLPSSAGVHALTVGAIASMIMAVAARAGKGHSGRALESDLLLNLSFMCITLTAILRIVAALVYVENLMQLTGLFWISGFVFYLMSMAKILLSQAPANQDSLQN